MLSKSYEPQEIEKKWYLFWEEKQFFKADPDSLKPAFCICMPPPNVTGVLHMGHALVNTLQDVLIRWKRMSGYEALWVPGTDHAGIATQTVVERHLLATEGKRRKDFTRKEFFQEIWQWKEASENQILNQLKKLGCSCDWSRLCFTMDKERSLAVCTLFKKMFDDDLIYRGDYLVNWDPVSQTALADDEVEYEEKSSFLWYINYSFEDVPEQFITVATTRPETMLGDTALAVSIRDERYKHLIGKRVIVPFVERSIPIIADHLVDPSFGTGVVKVTPAHDLNDYQMGQTHKLDSINIMTPDGRINEQGKEFSGLTMQEARIAIVDALQKRNFISRIEPHNHRVGISYRSKAIIEPYLSKQWFVRVSQFKDRLRKVVEDKKVHLIPPHWENTYFHWIDHLRDWCISRQLWWGHQIPIWYNKNNPDQILVFDGINLPLEVQKDPDHWYQDEDVLDTWFSSAIWPFSTLGWPHQTQELKKFYPNSTLITGHDILFFWVARMILMGEYALNQPPFPEVFLHGLIYGKSYWRHQENGSIAYLTHAERLPYELGQTPPSEIHSKWEKMSKSKGNIIDPLEVIDFYGTDAMRMGLCASATQARQIDLDRRRFEEFKNFVNKIWNGARFVFMNIEDLSADHFATGLDLSILTLEDHWIFSLLNRTIQSVNGYLKEYAFDKALSTAYDFFWNQFCAYYVELAKPILANPASADRENKQKILSLVLFSSIRLLHPIAPFVTEEIFDKVKQKLDSQTENKIDPYTQEALLALKHSACIVSNYPQAILEDIRPDVEETFTFLDQVTHAIRTIRAEMQMPPNMAIDLFIQAPSHDEQRIALEKNCNFLKALIRIQSITFTEEVQSLPFSAEMLISSLKLQIPLPQELKIREKIRLVKEKEKLIQQQNKLRTQLANTNFLEKAPSSLVSTLKDNLSQAEKQLEETLGKLNNI
jgi:valyl-tRNA synthetase